MREDIFDTDEEFLDKDDLELSEDQEQGMFEHYRFELDKGQAPMRVDKYLATHM